MEQEEQIKAMRATARQSTPDRSQFDSARVAEQQRLQASAVKAEKIRPASCPRIRPPVTYRQNRPFMQGSDGSTKRCVGGVFNWVIVSENEENHLFCQLLALFKRNSMLNLCSFTAVLLIGYSNAVIADQNDDLYPNRAIDNSGRSYSVKHYGSLVVPVSTNILIIMQITHNPVGR